MNHKWPHASAATPVIARATLYGTTYYIHSFDGKLLAEYDAAGICQKDYVYMGNKLIAEYQPMTGAKYYYTSDQINSTRMITDSSGAVVYSAMFDPFGGMQKQWVNTYSPDLKFSGKERESKSELDYFGARYYDHLRYRFISVDPVINKDEALANPQLWNLYSYCRNNPVTFFDPDGRWDEPNHDLSIGTALKGILSGDQIQMVINSNNWFDSTQQSDQYVHSMLNKGENNPEGMKRAMHMRDNFKTNHLKHIRESRAKRFASGDKSSWSTNELILLGELQHPFVDETCPSHNWQEWGGTYVSFDAYKHWQKDKKMSSAQLQKNVEIIKQIYNEASK